MVKRLFFFLFPVTISFTASGQLPEDALRLSYLTPSGSARQQAIGGAMGSLGGEISAMYVNPAGLGFYKTNEMVVSPGFRFSTDKSQYLGNNQQHGSEVTRFNLGTSGFIFGINNNEENSATLGIGVNQTANFNGDIFYQGKNNQSSFSEQYVEEFANSNLSIDDGIRLPGLSYGTRMALTTYLIDTATIGGNQLVIGQPEKVLAANGFLNQSNQVHTTGGVTELALALAGSSHNKWYYGVTIGVPIVNYHRDLSFTETDGTGNTNNDFDSFTYRESYSSKGVGVNAKLGAIFRPSASWRIGIALHTPSFYSLTDKISASLNTNTENYAGKDSITSGDLDQLWGSNNSIDYQLSSPWRMMISGSYVFGAQENVKDQKGFVTADIEYVTVKSARFSVPTNDDGSTTVDNSYYDGLNSTVKSYYKNNLNFRAGGELKLNTMAIRAGFAYSLSPYAQTDLKANRMYISGGVGYRNKGIFVDLTYVEGIVNDTNFPYRLADKPNVVAQVRQISGTVLMTVGFKF
jgi:hypothetical protein